MPEPLPSRVIADISFVGRGGGLVKNLDGFKKGHHTVPDAANAVTNGFLAKIAEPELAAEAERLFQDARARLGYKRREAALSRAPGSALLTTKHFTIEITYALEAAAPERYVVTTTLRGLQGADLVQTEEFSALFAGAFAEISFALRQGARVEQVVDLIEDLDGAAAMTVTYPSDCRECTIRVPGVAAEVHCTGAALDLVFPRPGSPRELLTEFAAVRSAFAVSQELAGLIG
ncbi:MAG: hypothetical protein JSR48_04065 [Verrucomicrobia bacterium]|nr:hypothetical protein [Verrucomicrobiota bacterium]